MDTIEEPFLSESEMVAVAACGECECGSFLLRLNGTMECAECGCEVLNAQWLFTAEAGRA